MAAFSMENRPLKKLRLGPPDVYPQDPKQKEDELTPVNVKQGFSHTPNLSQSEEYGSARNHNISLSKVQSFINGVLGKKQEMNTLPDTGRKRQPINPKDNFHNVTPKSKAFVESWFKDLAGNKPLLNLGKRVPIFNKKEEIFIMLSEYQVPMVRAIWLIKMTSAYTVAMSEAKMKKRQLPDSSQEWTKTLVPFMKEQLMKLQEFYQKNGGSSSSQTPATASSVALASASNASSYHNGSPLMTDEQRVALRQFNYCQQLCKVMYEEGLIDCQDFLAWILDMVEKCKTCDDGLLRLVMPLVLQYTDEFVQCESLSRKLVFQVCKRIAPLLQATMTADSSQSDPAASQAALDVSNCAQHRGVLVQMSAVIQAVVLHCPTAVVWNFVGEGGGKIPSYLVGSPLDQLSIPPSALPMAPRFSNDHVRELLREAEHRIKIRSKAAEKRWCLEQLCRGLQVPLPPAGQPSPTKTTTTSSQSTQSTSGVITTRVLQALEALDRHSFDRMDSSNSIDTLYSKIFPPVGSSSGGKGSPPAEPMTVEQVNQQAKEDEPLVKLLCQWAVSDQRYGEHRALAAALLLEKRQADLVAIVEGDGAPGSDDNDTEESSSSPAVPQPIYQGFLMLFLDTEAPTLNEPGPAHNNRVFASLVHLFYELIKHDVFSHDMYMCSLISRGDLLSATPASSGPSASGPATSHPPGPVHHPIHSSMGGPQMGPAGGPGSNSGMGPSMGGGFQMGGMGMGGMHDLRSELDDSKIDDDLGEILQHIKKEQQIVMDTPDSPKDEHHGPLDSTAGRPDKEGKRQSRHLLYTTHFPLPQDDSLVHDCNQRHILLYGVGKAREEARHSVKKVSKEVCRLFHKKLGIDVQTEGTGSTSGTSFGGSSKSRKHSSRIEFNFEVTMQRFMNLSYFDRHAVASQAVTACLEMISGFTAGTSSSSAYLPVLEHVSFLFDLFEVSLSISGLIEFCLQLLKELPEVESLLSQRNSVLSRVYVTNLGLYVVGVLRRFHCCLLLSPESTAAAFEFLCRIVKHVTNPADCSSAERCILAYLYDLYSCCSFLKVMKHESSSGVSGSGSGRGGTGGSGSMSGSGTGSEVFAFANAYPKIKTTIFAAVQPSTAVHQLNREFLTDLINNPRRKPESIVLRQLSESAQLRYSFVCNVVVAVCNTMDNDRLNDIALLCAELTAGCSALSAEWLGVLTALCFSAQTYIDVLTQVDVQDRSIHKNLAVLFSVLLARHCFGLQDFLLHVGVPSLVKVWNEGCLESDSEAEAGARLTCHLVLRLFKTSDAPHPACYSNSSHSVNASPHHTLPPAAATPHSPNSLGVKLACDRHLLAATHNSISVAPVLGVLKAILVLADRVPADVKSGRTSSGGNSNNSSNNRAGTNSLGNELSISHILGTLSGDLDLDLGSSSFGTGGRGSLGSAATADQNVTLSTYARYVLTQICTQPWVHQRCLQNPDELLKPDGLLDSCLSSRQAQRLLQMISRPESASSAAEDTSTTQPDYRQIVNRVLDNLDQWRLRVAWLDLQLLYRQLVSSGGGGSSTNEMNLFLDATARAIVDVFELCQPDVTVKEEPDLNPSIGTGHSGSVGVKGGVLNKRNESGGSSSPRKSGGGGGANSTSSSQSISLIAPLVSKLPGSVQGRILKVASQVLESCNWIPPSANKHKDGKEAGNKSGRSKSLLAYEPLLALIMTCVKGQDEMRELFLSSLHGQLSHYNFLPKEDRLYHGEDVRARRQMLEALQLRFSLVGGLFDSILRSPTATVDWAVLLVQLVTSGVVDLSNNTELFPVLQDMIATLLHSTQVSDAQSERGEDGKKYYQNLIKKLKKELAERKGSPSIQPLKQLLPLPKPSQEFVTCEAYGTATDNKGNKIQTDRFDNTEKKQGMRLHDKQRVSPWDIIEGQKTPAPLSWAWFGAVRMERKPLRYQETHRLLRHHTHIHQKSAAYFLEHPALPAEELEPPPVFPEKSHILAHHVVKEEPNNPIGTNPIFKMEVGMVVSEQSPRGASKRGQKTGTRRPRGRRGGATVPIPPQQPQVGYQNPAGPPGSGIYPPPPQWSGYNATGPGPQQPPQQPQPQQPPQPQMQQAQQHQQQQQQVQQQQQQQQQQVQQQQQQGGGPAQGYFPQMGPGGVGMSGPRFPPDGRPGTQSRQALSNMLRQKNPGMSGPAQFVPGSSGTPPGGPSMPAGGGGVPGVPGNPGVVGGVVGPMGVVGGPGRGVPGQQQQPQGFQNMSMVEKQRQQQLMRQMRQQQPQVPIVPGGGPQGPQGGFPSMHANQNPNFPNQGGGNFGMQQQQGPQQGNVMGMAQQPQPQQQASMMQPQHFNQQQGGGNFPMGQQQPVQQGNVMGMQPQGRGMANPAVRSNFMQQQPGGGMQMGQAGQFARAPAMANPQAQQQQQQQQVRIQQQMMAQQHGQMQQQQHGHNNYHQQYN